MHGPSKHFKGIKDMDTYGLSSQVDCPSFIGGSNSSYMFVKDLRQWDMILVPYGLSSSAAILIKY